MISKFKKRVEVLNTEKAKGYRLAQTAFHEIVNLHLEPGGVISEHSLPVHVVFYVMAGAGTVSIDGFNYEGQCGDVVEVSQGSQRSWTNTGTETLKLLVIKTPVD